MTEDEYQKLVNRYGDNMTNKYISNLDTYIGSKGDRYKSHYYTVLNWINRDGVKPLHRKEPIPKEELSKITEEQRQAAKEMMNQAKDKILARASI